ncbi:Cobyric acid synthase [Clostridiaceae bacterium JG1575]|nr:Cobyric acid synthase [Clostridiaceae bacterium JG1575]
MTQRIMIVGTSSGAGKSTLTTGLCRILKQEGYRVAPFKSQNMSNNKYVLPSGKEMAKSQAIAAAACGLPPHEDMNPILLKLPGQGIDLVLRGEPQGLTTSEAYSLRKPTLWPMLEDCMETLAKDRDVVVVEGAGSPVELNLEDEDLVNMGLARHFNIPVLLVADIDRGGVFASVMGTLMLLPKTQRHLIRGIIINRMRGDAARFEGVRQKMEEVTGLPVVGMVPFMHLLLEDEDGLVDSATGPKPPLSPETLDQELDRLARELRDCLDLRVLGEIMGLPLA